MSVLLDTSMVSELLRLSPNPAVESWVGERPSAELYFSAVGEAELRYGVAMLPAGQRKGAFAAAIEGILQEDFEDRILPINCDAARADANFAAIARSRGMALVTRSVRDFEDIGIEIVDPWAGA